MQLTLQIMWELAHKKRLWHELTLAAVRERVGWRKQQPAFSSGLPELFTVCACSSWCGSGDPGCPAQLHLATASALVVSCSACPQLTSACVANCSPVELELPAAASCVPHARQAGLSSLWAAVLGAARQFELNTCKQAGPHRPGDAWQQST